MDVSIIIVNYNVRFFLEQCLHSVFKAKNNLNIEIIVVDNHSVDGSVQMLKEKFPQVIVIENKDNVGFSKANNQGIKIARGKYVLLLNPDTVLQEDTLVKCFEFMEATPDAGALGVKMFDGKGNFLPESKRGFPSPMVAFYKIFGLSKLFPKSKIFGRYHLGFLDKDKTHNVDVLSGAFMFIRKEVLNKIGGLDEDYFMYGEDIDLSYRIKKAGYNNYYFADTSIIHYKGESTKKSSVNYVIVFYKAMVIFANKHFSSSYAKIFHFLIYIAIYLRAGMSIGYRFIKRIALPLVDLMILMSLILIFAHWYEINYKATENYFDKKLLYTGTFIYSIIAILNLFFQGGYEKYPKYKNIFQGLVIALLMSLSIYALLPENLRFSRAIIVMSSVISFIYFTLSRWLFYFIGLKRYSYLASVLPKNIVIVGDEEEFERVKNILQNIPVATNFLGLIKTDNTSSTHPNFSGYLKDLEEIVKIEDIDEIIFCSKHLNAKEIIYWMTRLSYLPVHYKIAPPNELYIIGSNDIHSQGELYNLEFKTILLPENQRKKRLIDIVLSTVCLLLSPLLIWIYKNKKQFILNCIDVLVGKKTWIGFGKLKSEELPKIKPSVLFIGKLYGYDEFSNSAIDQCYVYSKDYKPYIDLVAFFKMCHLIDRV